MAQHRDTDAIRDDIDDAQEESLEKLGNIAKFHDELIAALDAQRKSMATRRANALRGAAVTLGRIDADQAQLDTEKAQLEAATKPYLDMLNPPVPTEDDEDGTQPPAPAPTDAPTPVEVPPIVDAPEGYTLRTFVISGKQFNGFVKNVQPAEAEMLQAEPFNWSGTLFCPVIIVVRGNQLLVYVTFKTAAENKLRIVEQQPTTVDTTPVVDDIPAPVEVPPVVIDTPAPAPEPRQNHFNPANWSWLVWFFAAIGAILGISFGWNVAPMDGFAHFVWTLGFGCVGFFGFGGFVSWLANRSTTQGRHH